jgi:hypothetical protein
MTTHSLIRVVRLRSTKADDRHIGQAGQRQEVIDAGAAGEDHLQIRRALETGRDRASRASA